MVLATNVTGAYNPTYEWGGPHCHSICPGEVSFQYRDSSLFLGKTVPTVPTGLTILKPTLPSLFELLGPVYGRHNLPNDSHAQGSPPEASHPIKEFLQRWPCSVQEYVLAEHHPTVECMVRSKSTGLWYYWDPIQKRLRASILKFQCFPSMAMQSLTAKLAWDPLHATPASQMFKSRDRHSQPVAFPTPVLRTVLAASWTQFGALRFDPICRCPCGKKKHLLLTVAKLGPLPVKRDSLRTFAHM